MTDQAKEIANVHVRWMIRRDMPEVCEIEQSRPDGWSEEELFRTLRDRNTIGNVAEHGEKVVGHVVYSLHEHRLEIEVFAVHSNWRRRSIGKTMVAKMIRKLARNNRTKIRVDIPERNLGALLFFRAQGFRAVQTLRASLDDSDDLIRMEYRLADAECEFCQRPREHCECIENVPY